MAGRKVETAHNTHAEEQPPLHVVVKRAELHNNVVVYITREQIVEALEGTRAVVEINGKSFEFSEDELLRLLRGEEVGMGWRASSERYF